MTREVEVWISTLHQPYSWAYTVLSSRLLQRLAKKYHWEPWIDHFHATYLPQAFEQNQARVYLSVFVYPIPASNSSVYLIKQCFTLYTNRERWNNKPKRWMWDVCDHMNIRKIAKLVSAPFPDKFQSSTGISSMRPSFAICEYEAHVQPLSGRTITRLSNAAKAWWKNINGLMKHVNGAHYF